MKTVVLIPAHNEASGVADVVKKTMAQDFPVVVVDDGSQDRTAEVAKAQGAVVIRNEKNLGKGAALRRGFEYILKQGFDAVITMDADGQHDPASLADFIRKVQFGGSDFIVGNRMSSTDRMPLIRVLTNRLMSFLLSKKIGQYIPDTQCGFRFIKTGLLSRMQLWTSKYEIESEMLIQAGRLGSRIDSIPVKSIYTGQTSRIRPIVDTFRFIRLMMQH
jgi:glycosyltransferase involved in cell wall biosynthesis